MDTEKRILENAEHLFFQYGIRSVTMDDIAHALSISKKTIYQHFKDKNEIVLRVSERVFAKERQLMSEFQQQSRDVVHEIVLASKYLREHVVKIHPSVISDLQKFYKDAWQVFLAFKQEELTFIEGTIRKGMQEGFFRSDINPRVLAVLRMETVELIFNQQAFPREQFDSEEVQTQIFNQFIHGILSKKGRKLLKQYTEKDSQL